MLKNIYFACCMALAGSLLCVGDIMGSQDAPIVTPKKPYFIPGLITMIAGYCMPTAEINLTVNLNDKNSKKTNAVANARTDHFELLFLNPYCFRLNRLTHCQNHDVDYFYTDIEKSANTGRWAKTYTHQAVVRTRYGANDKPYKEEIKCLNAIEKSLGKPYYQDGDAITRNGITSMCTIRPYVNNTVSLVLDHDTTALSAAIDKALNT